MAFLLAVIILCLEFFLLVRAYTKFDGKAERVGQAERKSFEMERQAGLVFSVYGRAHFLWDGYWEWKTAELSAGSSSDLYPGVKLAWFLRPEGSKANLWIRTPDQSQAERLLKNPGKGTYVLMWNEYSDVGVPEKYHYAVDYQPPKKAGGFDTEKARGALVAENQDQLFYVGVKGGLKGREQSLENLRGAVGLAQFSSSSGKKCPHWNEGQRLGPCCVCASRVHLYKPGDPRCVTCLHWG